MRKQFLGLIVMKLGLCYVLLELNKRRYDTLTPNWGIETLFKRVHKQSQMKSPLKLYSRTFKQTFKSGKLSNKVKRMNNT